MEKVLILGFGRMGITHLAHLNGLLSGKCKFDIFDPSKIYKTASFFRLRSNIRFLRDLSATTSRYDAVFITSPPHMHAVNYREVLHLSDRFFIEKPLTLSEADLTGAWAMKKEITCGYVLRRNPCVSFLKDVISDDRDLFVEICVKSNLGKQAGGDWRYDIKRGGGCINELGSHAINLGLNFIDWRDFKNEIIAVNTLTVGSFDIQTSRSARLTVKGDWNLDVRKTTYNVKIFSQKGTLRSDLQSVTGEYNGQQVNWSPRQSHLQVGYYMRGIDFALQAEKFVEGQYYKKDLKDAALTDDILALVLNHA